MELEPMAGASFAREFGPPVDLGTVHGVAELLRNGESPGRRWFGCHHYPVRPGVAGPVSRTIRVTITAANQVRTLDDPTARRWARARKDEGPALAGLVGPVELLR